LTDELRVLSLTEDDLIAGRITAASAAAAAAAVVSVLSNDALTSHAHRQSTATKSIGGRAVLQCPPASSRRTEFAHVRGIGPYQSTRNGRSDGRRRTAAAAA